MNVTAKDFEAGGPILLEERGAGEADEDCVRHYRLHRAIKLAALGAMTFVDKNEDFAHRGARLCLQLFDEGIKVVDIFLPELMNERAEKARLGLAQLAQEITPTVGTLDRFAGLGEDPFDLLIELVAVGDDHDACMGIVFEDPFGEQHHDDAFAAALGMPNDAALLLPNVFLGRLDTKILMHPRQLLHAAVKQDKIMH
ncbi:hypothetical protein MJC1_02711 [Methylocystis sp. MJC1]|nr:hypothetical protein MJC1_02711 [Methylocystis sp. MJC1]